MRVGVSAGSLLQSGSPFRMCGEGVRDCFPMKRPAPRQALIEHAAESPDVGPLVHCPPSRLLGTHVGRRPQDDARLGHLGRDRGRLLDIDAGRLSPVCLGQPEIQDLDLALRA